MEDGFVVVGDGAGFAVHQVRGANDLAAKSRADGLMSEADSEDRHLSRKMLDQLNADSGVLRGAGAG